MVNKELLKDQIAITFPDSSSLENELIGLDIENFGRLVMSKSLDVSVKYKNIHKVEFKYTKMFFEARLNFEYSELYLQLNSIRIYPREYKIKTDRSNFEISMGRAKVFIDTAQAIFSYLNYLQHTE